MYISPYVQRTLETFYLYKESDGCWLKLLTPFAEPGEQQSQDPSGLGASKVQHGSGGTRPFHYEKRRASPLATR